MHQKRLQIVIEGYKKLQSYIKKMMAVINNKVHANPGDDIYSNCTPEQVDMQIHLILSILEGIEMENKTPNVVSETASNQNFYGMNTGPCQTGRSLMSNGSKKLKIKKASNARIKTNSMVKNDEQRSFDHYGNPVTEEKRNQNETFRTSSPNTEEPPSRKLIKVILKEDKIDRIKQLHMTS